MYQRWNASFHPALIVPGLWSPRKSDHRLLNPSIHPVRRCSPYIRVERCSHHKYMSIRVPFLRNHSRTSPRRNTLVMLQTEDVILTGPPEDGSLKIALKRYSFEERSVSDRPTERLSLIITHAVSSRKSPTWMLSYTVITSR